VYQRDVEKKFLNILSNLIKKGDYKMIYATRRGDCIALTDSQGDEVDFVDIDDAKKIIEEIQQAIKEVPLTR
jgi:hypothetical protein